MKSNSEQRFNKIQELPVLYTYKVAVNPDLFHCLLGTMPLSSYMKQATQTNSLKIMAVGKMKKRMGNFLSKTME